MTGNLFEVHCLICGVEDVFVSEPPKKFVCNDCKEKQSEEEMKELELQLYE